MDNSKINQFLHLCRTPQDQVREGGRTGFVNDLVCPPESRVIVGCQECDKEAWSRAGGIRGVIKCIE